MGPLEVPASPRLSGRAVVVAAAGMAVGILEADIMLGTRRLEDVMGDSALSVTDGERLASRGGFWPLC